MASRIPAADHLTRGEAREPWKSKRPRPFPSPAPYSYSYSYSYSCTCSNSFRRTPTTSSTTRSCTCPVLLLAVQSILRETLMPRFSSSAT
jgi:hypothetical protein